MCNPFFANRPQGGKGPKQPRLTPLLSPAKATLCGGYLRQFGWNRQVSDSRFKVPGLSSGFGVKVPGFGFKRNIQNKKAV
jgi:hypothetical protein